MVRSIPKGVSAADILSRLYIILSVVPVTHLATPPNTTCCTRGGGSRRKWSLGSRQVNCWAIPMDRMTSREVLNRSASES